MLSSVTQGQCTESKVDPRGRAGVNERGVAPAEELS